MTDARPSWIKTLVAYVLITPPVCTLIFLVVLGAPADMWTTAAGPLLVFGFSYIVGAVPALVTGVVAAAVWPAARWIRLLAPAICAAALARIIVGKILHAGPGPANPDVSLALMVGGAIGALAAGIVVELRRRRRQPADVPPG